MILNRRITMQKRKKTTVKGMCVGKSKSILIILYKLILCEDLNVYRIKIHDNNGTKSRGYIKGI